MHHGSVPLVLGHRGYRSRFPENTLLAFREALGAGADGIECDLQKSSDGRYVVIHDPRTARTAGRDLEVSASTLEQLLELDFGRGERIPTLEDLLRALPAGAWLDLELKSETITLSDCEPIARILDASFPRSNLMVSSFEPELLRPFRARGFRVGLLVGEEAAQLGMRALASTLLRLRPQYVNLPVDMLQALGARRSRWIAAVLRAAGFSLLYWTVNEPEQILFAAERAQILVTDDVGRAVGTLRS